MNRLLLPAKGTRTTFTERVDERGIPIPDWWTEDDADSSIEGTMLFAAQLRNGTGR